MTNLLTNAEQAMVIRLAVVTTIVLSAMVGMVIVVSGSGPASLATTYVYDNSTVYVNTTSNTSVNHWDNTTTYVNSSTSVTVYVNTTYVEEIPVVVVPSITVDFANGTSISEQLPTNYSLPVGTVTWVQFEMTGNPSSLSVNAPWTLLSFSAVSVPPPVSAVSSDCIGHGPELVTVLVGVPYMAGTDPMVVSAN